MKLNDFLQVLALTLLVGCAQKPLTEEQAMAECVSLAREQKRELNCHHCDRCYFDPYTQQVVLEETQAAKVIKTWKATP